MVGSVLVVVGASGGVGASSLATAVAVRAVRAGLDVVLVDGCPLGGGLDVVLGAEQAQGVRWSDLSRLEGSADGPALLVRLPLAEGVRRTYEWYRANVFESPRPQSPAPAATRREAAASWLSLQ